jgi:spore germination protein GerM
MPPGRSILRPLTAAMLVAVACAGDAPRAGDDGAAATPAAADAPGRADTTPAGRTTVSVYFTENEQRVAVRRSVPATPAVLRAALEALLEGPTEEERARGLTSWFSGETAGMLLAASIDDDGHATVDFADFSGIIPNASASAGSAMLLGELDATVFQFDAVRSVEYRFEGDCARFFEWLQRSCARIARPG